MIFVDPTVVSTIKGIFRNPFFLTMRDSQREIDVHFILVSIISCFISVSNIYILYSMICNSFIVFSKNTNEPPIDSEARRDTQRVFWLGVSRIPPSPHLPSVSSDLGASRIPPSPYPQYLSTILLNIVCFYTSPGTRFFRPSQPLYAFLFSNYTQYQTTNQPNIPS